MNVSAPSDGPLRSGGPQAPRPLAAWQRWLLPAILGTDGARPDPDGGTDLPRSARDWVADIALFGFAVAVGLGFLATKLNQVSAAMFVFYAVLAMLASLGLWGRRRRPVTVGWLTVGLAVLSDAALGAALVALLTVAVHCAPRRTLVLAVLEVIAAEIGSIIYAHGLFSLYPFAFWLVVSTAVVGVGLYVKARRELLLSLQDRAWRAEEEQKLQVREAKLAERARIAREMHDVLAHRISLLSLHAGALEFNPDASPEEIARAAMVIRVGARAAQEELREVVGVLRTDPSTEPLQRPQPTLADLGALIDESRAAGLDVSLSSALEQPDLSPILGRTIYRLVQEGLTNVRKHAPGQVITVTIVGEPRGNVQVTVMNRPRVVQGEMVHPAARVDDHPESGLGLVGLAERVTLVGGQLTSESLPEGGFRLSATLPWSEAGAAKELAR